MSTRVELYFDVWAVKKARSKIEVQVDVHARSGGGVHEVPSSVAHVQWDAGRGGQVHQQQLYPCKLTRVGHIVVCMHVEDASVVFASHNRAEGLTVLACGHTTAGRTHGENVNVCMAEFRVALKNKQTQIIPRATSVWHRPLYELATCKGVYTLLRCLELVQNSRKTRAGRRLCTVSPSGTTTNTYTS